MSREFISLHDHSDTSILDGFSTNQEYIERAIELGMKGLGRTDHGNLFCIADFLKFTKQSGLIGVPGCEFYVAPENPMGAFVKDAVFYSDSGNNDVAAKGSYLHLTVWAYNNVGLHNLFRLSTLSFDPRRFRSKQRIDFNLLAEFSEGLIVATGCPSSEISTRFRLGQDTKAYDYANRLLEVFGRDRLFVEIMNHSMDNGLERDLLPKQLEMAKKMKLRLLATNDCHYAKKENAPHHEEMLCKQSGSRMSDEVYDNGGNRFAFSGSEYYLKDATIMDKLFPEDEFPHALESSLDIAHMVDSDLGLKFDRHLRPKPEVPDGETVTSYYKKLVKKGLRERYRNADPETKKEVIARSKKEDNVIIASGFAGYMLVVRDYLKFAKDNFSVRDDEGKILASSLGVGRGSVGGSIHAYALGISEIDPVRFSLIFERFLSAGRGAVFRVTYDDGTYEDLNVSESKVLEDGSKNFVHELEVGDTVLDEGN